MFKNMGYIPKDHTECYKVINIYKTDKHFMLWNFFTSLIILPKQHQNEYKYLTTF